MHSPFVLPLGHVVSDSGNHKHDASCEVFLQPFQTKRENQHIAPFFPEKLNVRY
jgi:hypothetical protein